MSANIWEPGGEIIVNSNNAVAVEHFTISSPAQSVFTLSNFTYAVGTNSIAVYINGVLQRASIDYYETSSASITFIAHTFVIGDDVTVIGQTELVSGSANPWGTGTETQYAVEGQTVFTIASSAYVANNGSLRVYINGLLEEPGDAFSEVAGDVVFSEGLQLADEVTFVFNSEIGLGQESAYINFKQLGVGAVTRNAQDKMRESVSVLDFGAVGDGVADDSIALQAACDAVYSSGGGTVYFPSGNYICNTPLLVQRNTNIGGDGRESTFITKDSTTTKAVTIVAASGVVYPGVLPSNINAAIVLDGAGGRYTGKISDITIQGTLATPGNYESQKVELGIVSIGSVSDFTLENVGISTFSYGWYFPNIFASKISNNRVSNCLTGSGIELGTSLSYSGNYINSCRDVGHYIRSLKYSQIIANACDSLNRADFYPTRTRTCVAYWLRSLVGCNVVSNGDEGTLGRSYYFNSLDNCVVEGNTTIAVGSDYVGSDEIAWHYSDGVMRCCRVANNVAYSVNASGLLYGGAIAGQHHNIYFVNKTNFLNSEYKDNIVRTALSAVTEAGWGNNTNKPSDYIEEGTFTPVIVGTTLAGAGTYLAQYGSYTRVANRVFFTLRLSWSAHTGTGNMLLDGLPYTARNTTNNLAAVTIGWLQNLALTAGSVPSGYIANNTTQITLEQFATGGGSTSAVPMDTAAGVIISGSYYAAA